MLNWFEPADIYCERVSVGFWAEPVNALTNLAFIAAGVLLFRTKQPPARLLGLIIMTIGLASFLFHTFANRLTGFLDVLFIGVYLVTYAWLWPKWVMRAGHAIRALSVAALLLAIALASWSVLQLKAFGLTLPPGAYLGAWLYIIVLATIPSSNHTKARKWLWATAGLFLVSMSMRQLDMPLCASLGGTHWIWHLLNAAVLYASAKALLAGTVVSNLKNGGRG